MQRRTHFCPPFGVCALTFASLLFGGGLTRGLRERHAVARSAVGEAALPGHDLTAEALPGPDFSGGTDVNSFGHCLQQERRRRRCGGRVGFRSPCCRKQAGLRAGNRAAQDDAALPS